MHRSMLVAIGVASVTGLLLAAEPAPQNPPPPPQAQRPTEVSVTLDNPGSHPKIGFQPVALSDTRSEVRTAAETVLDVLAADLNFEREFYVISRKSSAGVPVASTPQSLPYPR